MTSAREILSAIVAHLDAGGVLRASSPLLAFNAESFEPGREREALLIAAEETRKGAIHPRSFLHEVLAKALALDSGEAALLSLQGANETSVAPLARTSPPALAIGAGGVAEGARVAHSILSAPHGIYPGIAASVYHTRCEGLASVSLLSKLRRSPAHLRAYLDGAAAEERSDALTFGDACHAAILEPERFEREYEMLPSFGDCRKKEGKANRDAWRKERGWDEERECIPGVTLLTKADYTAIRGMVASVHAHPLASRLLVGGESEVTLRWRDERTGVECKGRADYWVRSHRLCVDLKTCEDARPQGFAKSVANWGYFRQEAFYRAGFDACGEPLEHYWLLAVERSPPFALAVYKLTAESVELGARHNEEDLATFARCLEIGEWPAYPRGVQELALPGWAT